ncbi:MAG: asparagine synthase (glutamine-hydrolyzing) [Bacteroidetes bacterium]|nr:asparagine synthase (glutamine-hydrolyzing) [Bacteroidota bacterium]
MCGIAGIVGNCSDKRLIPEMLDVMKHRGPDSRGFYTSDMVHLGHCRLSINDLSKRASQPFVSKKDGVAALINGEIYNFRELRAPLIKKGYHFKSNSDSEVVLHGYLDCGIDFIKKLNGMFAVAIWDGRKSELITIRDRLGIKPLYYSKIEKAFLFASEIKALAQYDKLPLSLDLQSFAEYMAYGNYFSNRTLNQEIKIVKPGEMVRFKLVDSKIEREYFWEPLFREQVAYHDGDVYSRYQKAIESSVKRHLISDVPVGSYLSSGIDSSSVVSYASRELNKELKTYTGYFGMSGFYDESKEAKKIAKSFGCSNTRVEISPQDFINNFETILWHLDEPRVGMGSFSQYMVAKCASKDVKVILTGHGGDEFFAGYPVFKAIYGKQHILKLLKNSSLRELMFAVYFAGYPFLKKEAGYFMPNIYSQKYLGKLMMPDFLYSLKQDTDIYEELNSLKVDCENEYKRLTLTYLKYFLPALFIVEDKISMAFSLESRTPLCDNEMLDLALSIPLSVKLSGYELKHVPRKAMRGQLPQNIYKLPKRGFPTPLAYWFKDELKQYVRDFILDNRHYINMFRINKVEKLLLRFQNAKLKTPIDEISAYKIWILLNLIVYFKNQRQRYKK